MNISIRHLMWACQATPEEIIKKSGATRYATGKRFYLHKDNGANVLAVAHLDTVVASGKKFGGVVELENGPTFFNPYLDDRAGIYTIMFQMAALGVKLDWLFTDEEEKGSSTAALFSTDKQYNWMVEFDRMGGDVVTYSYGDGWGAKGDGTWDDLIVKAGFRLGFGTFSDICAMQGLGIKALNVGVGYQEPHTPKAYMELAVYARQMRLFADFWNKYKDTKFEHVEKKLPSGYGAYNLHGGNGFFDSSVEWGAGLTKKERKAIKKRLRLGAYETCSECRNIMVSGVCIMCGNKASVSSLEEHWEWCMTCNRHTRHVGGLCSECVSRAQKNVEKTGGVEHRYEWCSKCLEIVEHNNGKCAVCHPPPNTTAVVKRKSDVITIERCARCNKVTRFVNYRCEECAKHSEKCPKCGTFYVMPGEMVKKGGCVVCREPYGPSWGTPADMSRYMCVACGATGMGKWPVLKCPSCGNPVTETKA